MMSEDEFLSSAEVPEQNQVICCVFALKFIDMKIAGWFFLLYSHYSKCSDQDKAIRFHL